jgi:hypothetical protein
MRYLTLLLLSSALFAQAPSMAVSAAPGTLPPSGGGFRRVEVTGGKMLQGNMQEIGSGLDPGTKVVLNALVLQNTVEQ